MASRMWQGNCRHLAVLCGFALLTIIIAWPLPLRMNEALAGEDIDDYLNPWVDWWTHHVLTNPGESLYSTDYLFYPDGVSLVFHSFSHTNTAVSLLLQPWIGQPAAYNVTILLSYMLSGFGMYLLIEHLTGSVLGGIISGFVFAFNPYHIYVSINPVLASTQWMPFSMLFLVRWLRESRRSYAVLSSLFYLLNALTSWHLMTFLSLWLVVFAVHYLACDRNAVFLKRLERLAVFAVMAGLAVLPFLLPLLREQLTVSQSYMAVDLEVGRSVDLRNLVLPPWVEPVNKAAYLGIAAVVLAAIGSWKQTRDAKVWLAGAALFQLIAIGPKPQINGEIIDTVTLPWSLPFIPLLRHTSRFQLLVMFGLAGAAGYGWVAIRDWLTGRRWHGLAAGAISLLLFFDYTIWPFPTVTPVVSEFYESLAAEPGDFAIAPLPSTRQTAKYFMYYQTIHGKRIVGGHVSRTPLESTRFLQEHELIRSVSSTRTIAPEITDLSRQFDRLATLNIRYLVLDKGLMTPDGIDQWRAVLPLVPAYEDEYLIAYNTDLEIGRDYLFEHALTPDVGILRSALSPPEEVFQGTFLGLEVYWGAAEPPGYELDAWIGLVDRTGNVAQVEQMPVYENWQSDQWTSDTIVIGRYRVRVAADLPPGEYDVQVGLADVVSGALLGNPVTLASIELVRVDRDYEVPVSQFPVDEGCFGDRLCLLGYDVDQQQDSLWFRLNWYAASLMERDYVASVRLWEPVGATLVWQRDVAPGGWDYPTTWWDVGEVVSTNLACDLEGVPAGRYQLAVIVYEPRIGEALIPSGAAMDQPSPEVLLLDAIIDVPSLSP